MREHTRTWKRITAALTAGALTLGSLTTAAWAEEPPFEVDIELVTDRLLAAQVQIHHGGQPGIERLLLSAELLEWRRVHPAASEPEVMNHLEAMSDALTDGITPPDRMRGEAEFVIRAASVLVAVPDSTAAAATHVKRLVEVTLGKSVAAYDLQEDVVNGSLRGASWLRARSQVEAELWAAVRRRSIADPAFASAWNNGIGYPTVDATASLAALKADPKLSALVDVDALLAQQGSRAAFLAEVQRQFGLVAVVLEAEGAQARARLAQLSAACPAKAETSCTPEQRAAAAATAASEQKEIDGAAAAAKLLGGLARIADQKSGEKIEKVATAWFSIVTAINKYAEAVAGRSAEDAILSAASVVLTGDILGAVMTLVSLLGESGPTLDQQILDQIVKLRQEVRALHQEMRASFERIEAQLNAIFDVMVHEFDKLNATLAGHTLALTQIQNKLAEQGLRLETVAATMLTAIGHVDLHDARAKVNQYIGYLETYDEPIPTEAEYRGAESEFHLAAIDIATGPSFVVAPSLAGDPTVDPTAIIDSNGESASLSYLARLARFRDPRVPDSGTPFANPSVWNFGAQAYALLALQNPGYASEVNEQRSLQIALEGERVLDVASSFSRPAATPPPANPTNPIFTTLLADYRDALARLGNRLKTIRTSQVQVRQEQPQANGSFVTIQKAYNLFGPTNQSVPPIPPSQEPATVKSCGVPPIGPVLARPANAAFNLLPPELRFAYYAYSPQMEDTPRLPQLGHCYDAQFVQHREVWGPLYHDTYARLRLTMRTRFRWARLPDGQPATLPDEQWRNARSASYTWPEIRIARECVSTHCSGGSSVEVEEELAARYPSGKALFEQSAAITVDNALVTSARSRLQAFLSGRQRAFYEKAAVEVHNANQPLNVAGQDMAEAARQLQAYTRLGFPVALSGDDILTGMLFGRYPLLVNKSIDPQLDTTFGTAFNRYACEPAVAVGTECYNPFGGAFQPLRSQPHLETYSTGIAITDPIYCSASSAGVPALPGDPVGDCVAASATRNLNRLAERYRHYSQLLVSGKYEERLPWIAGTLATLPLVQTIVRTAPEPSN